MSSYPHIKLAKGQRCQWQGCRKMATTIACGRSEWWSDEPTGHPDPGVYCDSHAEMVADERSPEYTDICPNCGCMHGVN